MEDPVDNILLTIRNEKLKAGEELRGAKRVKMKQGPRDGPWANLHQWKGKRQLEEEHLSSGRTRSITTQKPRVSSFMKGVKCSQGVEWNEAWKCHWIWGNGRPLETIKRAESK